MMMTMIIYTARARDGYGYWDEIGERLVAGVLSGPELSEGWERQGTWCA
jgi:hypothetical protein